MGPLWDLAAVLIQLYILVIFVSVILSWLIAFGVVDRRNRVLYQIADGLNRMIEPALRPIRRMLPYSAGLDLSPLVLLFILYFLLDVVIYGHSFWSFIAMIIETYIFIVIVSAILSWLIAFNVADRRNRAVYMIADGFNRMTEPALRPIRRLLPDLGGLDISPIILFLILRYLVEGFALGWLRQAFPI